MGVSTETKEKGGVEEEGAPQVCGLRRFTASDDV